MPEANYLSSLAYHRTTIIYISMRRSVDPEPGFMRALEEIDTSRAVSKETILFK